MKWPRCANRRQFIRHQTDKKTKFMKRNKYDCATFGNAGVLACVESCVVGFQFVLWVAFGPKRTDVTRFEETAW